MAEATGKLITCRSCRGLVTPLATEHWCVPTVARIKAGERHRAMFRWTGYKGVAKSMTGEGADILGMTIRGKVKVRRLATGEEMRVDLPQLRWRVPFNAATDGESEVQETTLAHPEDTTSRTVIEIAKSLRDNPMPILASGVTVASLLSLITEYRAELADTYELLASYEAAAAGKRAQRRADALRFMIDHPPETFTVEDAARQLNLKGTTTNG